MHVPCTAADEHDVGRPLAGEVPEHLAALVERPHPRLHLGLRAASAGMEDQACADVAELKDAVWSASTCARLAQIRIARTATALNKMSCYGFSWLKFDSRGALGIAWNPS